MEELRIKDAPPAKIKPTVEPGLLEETYTQTKDERQIVLHCSVFIPPFAARISIWETTFLYDIGSPKRSKLITAFNIAVHPVWSSATAGTMESFTLIFETLPKECNAFYLFEYTNDRGGFYTKPIERNNSDVYFVKILVTQD